MRRKGLSLIIIYSVLVTAFGMSIITSDIPDVNGVDPFFTLVAKVDGNNPRYIDYMNLVKQQLDRIGINLDLIVNNPFLENSIHDTTDFDICYFEYEYDTINPALSEYFSENGSKNIFGYHTDMDYDYELDTGLNEHYLQQGKLMYPPDNSERIEHYQNWQRYIISEITPCLPALSSNEFSIAWDGLEGYNISKGIIQSFGNMTWSSTHLQQENDNELVIADNQWLDLNPLIQTDEASKFISKAILDPLVWKDCDSSYWPHLTTNIKMQNNTHIRLQIREGIAWQSEPNNMFSNEFLNSDDIYFSLFVWKHLSNKQADYQWIEKISKINDTTVDIFIDENPDTNENEPYTNFLDSLATIYVLPEHYLNQTQIADGITPDITHNTWKLFSQHCFGTGMFKLCESVDGKESVLKLSTKYWGLNESLVNDSDLNFKKRFGGFDNTLEQLRIKNMSFDKYILNEFEKGSIDLVERLDYTQVDDLKSSSFFFFQNKPSNKKGLIGFNLRPFRTVIGNPDSAPGDSSMTVGQAIRTAICHAINIVEINEVVHGGKYNINQQYLPINLQKWWNNHIGRYHSYDFDLAKEYRIIAGYEAMGSLCNHEEGADGMIISIIFVCYILPALLCITILGIFYYSVVRRGKKSDESMNFTKIMKFYCYYCQKSIKRDSRVCPKCKNEIPHCIVCSLPISKKSIIGRCIHCNKAAHLTHLQEWLKVKGYCPNCDMKLSETEIIIEGYEKDSEYLG